MGGTLFSVHQDLKSGRSKTNTQRAVDRRGKLVSQHLRVQDNPANPGGGRREEENEEKRREGFTPELQAPDGHV